MKLGESIKSISHVKAHMSEIVDDMSKTHKKIIITQNGEAKAVLQDIESFDEMQESLAMLKLVAMSTKSMVEGKEQSLDEAFSDVRKRIRKKGVQ
jgi:prevent-host-death family protein